MHNHRFINELNSLEATPINGRFSTLVIGTFNSENQDGLNNDSLWYYGRCQNEFWYLFPQINGYQSLHQRDHPDISPRQLSVKWKDYCLQNRVVIVDIFKSISTHLTSHSDSVIENPEQFVFFDYQTAFQQVQFNNILFTWKSRTNKHILGRRKEEIHNWFSQKGSRILHMITPSYAYRKRKEIKLESWLQIYNAQ